MSERKKSFQMIRPVKIATVPVTGRNRGKTTFRNVRNELAPSTREASSYSFGRAITKPV